MAQLAGAGGGGGPPLGANRALDGRYLRIADRAEVLDLESVEHCEPNVIAIYGANASGRTAILKALQFLIWFARDSSQRSVEGLPCEWFNDPESGSRPVRLAIELGGVLPSGRGKLEPDGQGGETEYGVFRYEVEIEVVEGLPHHVRSEALRQKPGGQGKWQRIFERDEYGKVKDSRFFSLTGFQHLLNTLRNNDSVLSSFSLFRHPQAEWLLVSARKVVTQVGRTPALQNEQAINFYGQAPPLLARLDRELSRIDVGLEEMRLQQVGNGLQAMFRHSGLQWEMPWVLESHGTQSFIRLFPLLVSVLENGGICIVDEFDAAMHPLILSEIVSWFYDRKHRNPEDGQLWFASHSVSLLDDLKKEEVVLCEKDRQGRTSAHSLMDVKIRRDENFYRKYLSGAYGGVPQIG